MIYNIIRKLQKYNYIKILIKNNELKKIVYQVGGIKQQKDVQNVKIILYYLILILQMIIVIYNKL